MTYINYSIIDNDIQLPKKNTQVRKGQQYFKLKRQANLCSNISGNVLGQKVWQNFMSKASAPPPQTAKSVNLLSLNPF